MLEFIILILYPEKPKWVTMMVGNTIFGTLFRIKKVNWGQVIQEIVDKLVFDLEKEKPSPISPYLFHLYHRFECLRGDEIGYVSVSKVLFKVWCKFGSGSTTGVI